MSRTQPADRLSSTNLSWTQWWNRARYQLYAPIYDAVARPLERGRERAVNRLGLQPGERVLILGAGTGSDLNYLPCDVGVTALDAVPAMVERTRRRAEDLDMNVEVCVGDAQDLPFEDEAFDAVLLHLILSVVPDPKAVATETARVLAPGGRVSIYDKFVPQGTEPSLLRRTLNPVARFLFSDLTRELDPLLSHTGLEVVEPRKSALGGLYTIALARLPADESTTSAESTQTVR